MKFLTRRFAHAPEGAAVLFFIQIFYAPWRYTAEFVYPMLKCR